MKKLNITKERFNKSHYFQTKYGKLKYVSESGDIYKTSKGNLIKFNEGISDLDTDIDTDIDTDKNKNSEKRNFLGFDDLKKYIEDECDYTREAGSAVDGDGRIGSIEDEGNLISWLNEIFMNTNVQVLKPKARAWYDIELKVGGTSFYTNIKTTDGHSADNISSKSGVWYFINGENPSQDYYLLAMYKNQSKDSNKRAKKILFTSLGRLAVLSPNFHNQPFQIPWGKSANQTGDSGRSYDEQKQYVASIWYKSIYRGLGRITELMEKLKSISGQFVD